MTEIELFMDWAGPAGFTLDHLFMASGGVPENPFEDRDTKIAFDIWLASRKAVRPEAPRSGGVGLSSHEADVIAAAVQLAPLLEEGWDDQDTPEDQNEGSKACDALVAAVNAMLSIPSPRGKQ